tara:strand:- start:568 stop:996 length:429 start_codon:yes stop_codon:yes gene_type:complete
VLKIFISSILLIFVYNCSKQINYSGKILNDENLKNINFDNKENLLKNLGNPSFIDPVSNKYFYFSEKEVKNSVFSKKINYSYIFVFDFNNQDQIISSKVYDLKNNKDIELIKEETNSDVVKRGLLERMFGGIGPQKEIATTP